MLHAPSRTTTAKEHFMKANVSPSQTTRRTRSTVFAAACAVTLTALLSQPVLAHGIRPPLVPATLQVQAGNKPFLVGHATGTQNYVCVPSGSSFAWALFTPEATLFNRADKQIITHFFSPNPDEPNTDTRVVADGVIRAAWQARDTSTVWAKAAADPSFDPAFVRPNSVPWLLLVTAGVEEGPNGGD